DPSVMLLIDGNQKINRGLMETTVIKGDSNSYVIGAASIIAKVTRDRQMVELDTLYPQYGFAKHKGYGTKEHIAAIKEHGICPAHRKTFLKKIIDV
ncbi:MAG: ribonuclease HII, partial [Clostridiales bacterium]|nr:ribonuclease HII [Clostridiales bacterium]